MARHCPYRASFTQASRSQPARPTPTPAPRGTPQAIRGGTRGIRGIVRILTSYVTIDSIEKNFKIIINKRDLNICVVT